MDAFQPPLQHTPGGVPEQKITYTTKVTLTPKGTMNFASFCLVMIVGACILNEISVALDDPYVHYWAAIGIVLCSWLGWAPLLGDSSTAPPPQTTVDGLTAAVPSKN
eukprot:TRINITY_DN115561_c0_g1_i1.p1 TRINITY_DN115561_c0_g1~~TRINITY_DN115561_c0_g1_i1.p1  ORF type:complete len:114 (+),score=12.65 TRINITY_DN115561_c0_g1_i1:23-343(+)